MSLTQNSNRYPSFETPKLPELEFTFCTVLGGGSMDVHEGGDSGSKRSRVDVYNEEQNNVKKTRTLEERLAQLNILEADTERKVDVDMFEDVVEQGILNARALVRAGSLLEQAIKDIKILKDRVDDLEVEALDTQHDLDSAHHKIRIHERVIKRLVGADKVDFFQEYEQDSDEDDHSDELAEVNAQPQTDSSIY